MADDKTEQYLGDGLYASFDGYQVKLRAPRGFCEEDHVVYLDKQTFAALLAFMKKQFVSCQ